MKGMPCQTQPSGPEGHKMQEARKGASCRRQSDGLEGCKLQGARIGIKEKMRNMNIGKRIVFYTYIVIIPILILIYAAVTMYRYYTTREEYEEQQRTSINNLALSLDIVEEDVRYLSLNLAINQDVLNILNAQNAAALNADSQLWTHRAPVQVIEDIMALKGYIKTLSIYPENGVSPYLRCIDSSSAYLSDLETVKQTEIYEKAVRLLGKGVWISASRGRGEIYQANRSEKLVLCRAIYNQAKNKLLGYLTIGISQETVEELCVSILNSDEEGVLLLDQDGNVVISYGYLQDEVLQYLQEENLTMAADYHGTVNSWEIYTGPISGGGWHVCKVLPKKGFLDFFSEIVYIPLVLLIALAVGVWPILHELSNRISKPLQTVCEAMVQFRQGDFEQQVKVQNNDEVGQVASCFNQMVTDIRELINKNYIMVLKERESELAILQAQINPHFLYNALDSIYWQAIGEEDEETAESIYELAQLFRMVLGQGKAMVTVEMEMELLQRYLEIQKLRFHEQMEYHLSVDNTILGEKIPKLILQPFVENAVVHGMQRDDLDFSITVSARPDDGFLEFMVCDTGVGMNEQQLQKIWEEDQEKVFSGHRVGRYAIKNVKERLELRYGSQYQLTIESKPGQGTQVTIRIPQLPEEEQSSPEERDFSITKNSLTEEE